MAMIPVGMRYRSKVVGRSIKDVTCTKCGTQFIYATDRSATGGGFSLLFLDEDGARQRAQEKAARNLEETLSHAVEPIACPSCGIYQADMVLEARRRRGEGFKWVAIGAAFVACLVSLPVIALRAGEPGPWITSELAPAWIAIFALLALAAGLVIVRRLACSNWDPNTDTLWKRRRQPKEKGKFMFKEDYDREQAAAAVPAPPPDAGAR